MKKFTFLFTLVSTGFFATAQQTIQLKIRFLSGRQYKWDITTNVDMQLDSAGATHPIEGFPMKFGLASATTLTINTGNPGANQWIPMQVQYQNSSTKMT